MREPNNDKLKDAVILCRAQLQEMIHEETTFALFKLKRKNFDSGDKAGKMLAMRLKQLEAKHFISNIYDCDGQNVQDPKQINNCFKTYYTKLYETECLFNLEEAQNFFRVMPLPSLKETDEKHLDENITGVEIKQALKSLCNGKSPGADGFSIEFYKCFQDTLIPFLTILFNDIIKAESMPITMHTAVITSIPKPRKDHTQMGNYRPLSLLNSDYKLFAKILAMRLEKVVPSLVHFDQVGFVKGRSTADNIRRLLHVMNRAALSQHPAIMPSLDAEKAFDWICSTH